MVVAGSRRTRRPEAAGRHVRRRDALPINAATEPGLSFGGSGRGCNTLTGRFEVTQAEYTPDGKSLIKLTANFEQHCEGMTPALWGQVHIERDPPPPGLEISLVLSDRGTVNAKTGVATVSGEVTCTTSASVYINGTASERMTRFALAQGSFSQQIQCSTTPTKWSATIQPNQVPFGQGTASIDATASGWDPQNWNQVTDSKSSVVHLYGVKK